jgi:carbonic anhydrase
MKDLVEGYEKFRSVVYPKKKALFTRLAQKQQPQVLFLTCADSRIVPDLILQTEPGELFICRNAGNIVPPYGEMLGGVSATIEYAVCVLQVQHIIICGHSDCGAMRGALDHHHLTNLPNVAAWLRHSESARLIVERSLAADESPECRLRAMIRANVIQQMAHLRTHPSVAAALFIGQLTLHGWTYDIANGTLEALDEQAFQFTPLKIQRNFVARPKLELAL